ncbi:hypothetical protein BC832DRAFT_600673 [Gaertneriomyces semiglobifer]|nr:hypothetical protein BC832DRAFT_600673 [Gaertneriomyces semiglobifer]
MRRLAGGIGKNSNKASPIHETRLSPTAQGPLTKFINQLTVKKPNWPASSNVLRCCGVRCPCDGQTTTWTFEHSVRRERAAAKRQEFKVSYQQRNPPSVLPLMMDMSVKTCPAETSLKVSVTYEKAVGSVERVELTITQTTTLREIILLLKENNTPNIDECLVRLLRSCPRLEPTIPNGDTHTHATHIERKDLERILFFSFFQVFTLKDAVNVIDPFTMEKLADMEEGECVYLQQRVGGQVIGVGAERLVSWIKTSTESGVQVFSIKVTATTGWDACDRSIDPVGVGPTLAGIAQRKAGP